MTSQGQIFNIQKFSLHDGHGVRTIVFFKGCPLSCYWCSNPESINPNPCKNEKLITIDEVLKICLADRVFYEESGGGVTLSGGEPMFQHQFALELLKKLKQENIHTVIETSGYASSPVFEEVSSAADFLLFDIKHYDNNCHLKGTGVNNDQILNNLKNALEMDIPLLIRLPVIPHYNDSAEDARKFVLFFETMGIKKVQLLPFHQLGEKKYEEMGLRYAMKDIPQLHGEDLENYRQIFTENKIECDF